MTSICKNCEIEFSPIRGSRGWFCSRSCSNKFTASYTVHPYKGKRWHTRAGSNHHFWGVRRDDMTGDNNPNWKGGVSLQNRFNSEYKVWRKRVFERDSYTCKKCSVVGGYLHADHIKPYKDYPELRYSVSNGRTLCQECHFEVTFGRKMTTSLWGVTRRKAGVSF